MLQARRASLLVFATTFGWLSAPTVAAHIDLLEPEARAHGTAARGDTDIDENSSLKSGPCGQVVSGRSQRVATYAPGQTIQVRVREENAHVSYLRVSLDLDGEDFPLRTQAPTGPETQDVAAAAEAALGGDGLLAVYREDNDTPGFVHELDVTLPDQACDNCTLQVLQFMYDDPAAPYYFQCADLVIADPGGMQDAGAAPQNGSAGSVGMGSPGPSESFEGVATGSAGSGDIASAPMTTPLGAGGTTAASGSPSAPPDRTPAPAGSAAVASGSDGGSGGCSMLPHAGGRLSKVAAFFWLLALAFAFTRRRR